MISEWTCCPSASGCQWMPEEEWCLPRHCCCYCCSFCSLAASYHSSQGHWEAWMISQHSYCQKLLMSPSQLIVRYYQLSCHHLYWMHNIQVTLINVLGDGLKFYDYSKLRMISQGSVMKSITTRKILSNGGCRHYSKNTLKFKTCTCRSQGEST